MREQASFLIRNASIVTVDAERRIFERNGAIAIQGNRIAAVGTTAELAARYSAGEVIEGRGKAVIPGLVDLHAHSFMTRGFADDLELEEFLERVYPEVAAMTPDDAYVAARKAYLEAIKSGTTCVNEMWGQLDRIADAVDETGIRATLSCALMDLPSGSGSLEVLKEHEALIPELAGRANGRISVGVGIESVSVVGIETIRRLKGLSGEHDIVVQVHVNETTADSAESIKRHGKRSVRVLFDEGLLDRRCVAAHCVIMTDEDIELLAKGGAHVSHNPLSNSKCGMGIAPIPRMMDAGINVGIGHDASVCSNSRDIFEAMKFASLLHKANNKDAKLLPAQTVLEMATINGARALGLEDEIGSIEVGKRADLVLVDMNSPFLSPYISTGHSSNLISNLVYSMKSEAVDTVMIDGCVVMRDRRMQTVDEEEVCSEATQAAQSLVERMERAALAMECGGLR
ncbi:MAG: amidohydrolase [bacterium]|nr:amidohydrolase [bacterium]